MTENQHLNRRLARHSPPPLLIISSESFFFSMKSITRIDFNNARISCRKMSIFELNSLFLLMITFAFCIHSLILQTRVLQRSKTKKNVISYKNKFLKWLSDNRAQKFFSMNSVYAHIKVLDQRGTCKESICLRKENPFFFCQDAGFRSPPSWSPPVSFQLRMVRWWSRLR